MGFYPLRDHEEFVHDVSSYVPRSEDIKGALCTSRTVTDKLLKKNGSTLGTETKAFYRMVSKGKIIGFITFFFLILSQRKINN